MSNPISNYLGVHAAALPLREQRMQLIASNLSNADTPHFKARDLDFQAALEQAAAKASPLQTTHEQHLTLLDAGPRVFERAGVQPSLDGNTVDADTERAAYGRAALEYRASLSFIESKVRTMLTAITGQ
ncbi:flagellar basal body rod protein FlgB [Pseudoxanthomonas sp. F37]|jgi:flagellar basal-body rod protein FlgB|uniref:flagellar basal body rod protein FlgB n=1 Tax=Pseudomonadota TaxID=1224 RepID=UPI001FD24927|nr:MULTISPECIES: flagellar basal body rod protein FlgB [Pseudomonadota]UOV05236.1 flagellar basal body rod protein FlgB [Pseudoxanthomonas mexicana]UOV10236.1 flagellar basal body rod protein FlgB [Pseudoxanthomonas sp. F37]HSX91278.1 flagellar basal body rod protein FlgB [Hydrogenophaga sp.]